MHNQTAREDPEVDMTLTADCDGNGPYAAGGSVGHVPRNRACGDGRRAVSLVDLDRDLGVGLDESRRQRGHSSSTSTAGHFAASRWRLSSGAIP